MLCEFCTKFDKKRYEKFSPHYVAAIRCLVYNNENKPNIQLIVTKNDKHIVNNTSFHLSDKAVFHCRPGYLVCTLFTHHIYQISSQGVNNWIIWIVLSQILQFEMFIFD